jgi:predicted Zn-dependent protease
MKLTNILVGFVCSLAIASCATRGVRTSLDCTNPDERLRMLWSSLEELRLKNRCLSAPGDENLCDWTRRQIERLAFICPGHASSTIAAAILAYDGKQTFRAQQLLDEVLNQTGLHPDAAALRARIAIEEGNLPFATQLLREQIRLNPGSPELRETLAAALYLTAHYDEAKTQLNNASTLGSPRWRIAYHLGLIAEQEGDTALARTLYQEVLQLIPGYPLAEGRLKGLSVAPPKP